MKWVFIVVVMICIGCQDECAPEATRCDGQTVQVCNTNGDWENSDNCEKLSRGFPFSMECQWDADYGQHVCVPTEALPGDAGDAG